MSIQQGLISPPLSGRTYKADPPRAADAHKGLRAADVFGRATTSSSHNSEPKHFEHRHHAIHSPVKKHHDDLSHADRAAHPPTPPMSKDVRHDDHSCDRADQAVRHRSSSEGGTFNAAPSSSSSDVEAEASTANDGTLRAVHADHCFDTLNQGVDFKSDDEHNPFLDRRPSTEASSKVAASSAGHPHHSHPYYDEFDSDQDAEGSVDEGDQGHNLGGDTTPRASSSNATTPPPPARTSRTTYRPARPFSTHARVDNEPVTSVMPIRDTPKNPFLQGGPADNGFQGPNGHMAHRRAKQIPSKERGKIVYVFRGQRVTYADPEYDSEDDDDSDLDDERAKTNAFNPHHDSERPPRLQPKLLFPPTASSSSKATSSTNTHNVRSNARPLPATAPSGRGAGLPRAEFEEDTCGASGNARRDATRANGGGLFAAQIAAQRKQGMQAPGTAAMHSSRVRDVERQEEGEQRYAEESAATKDQRDQHETAAPSSSASLQTRTYHPTHVAHESRDWSSGSKYAAADESRRAARNALLARLDQTGWSDDENDEEDDKRRSGHNGRRAHPGGDETTDEEAYPLERQEMPRSQSQKRLSDELQRGHADELDATGRPMKRSRASYAY